MASSSEPSLLDRKREFATLYQDVCGNASVASARYGNAAGTCVRVSLSQRDLSADATRRFARTFVKTEETSGDWCSVSPFAVQEDGVVARLVSPSGRRLALVRAAEPKAGGKDDGKVVIEVTSQKMDDAEEFMDKVKSRVDRMNGNGHYNINVDVVDDDEE